MRYNFNIPVNKYLAAFVIAVVSLVPVVYVGLVNDWSEIEIDAVFLLLSLLWFLMSIGFILLVLGKTAGDITSEEKDKNIIEAYTNIRKRVAPFFILIFIAWLIWWFIKYAI